MFKLHKPQMSGSIHSGHFMVSRLDDDEDDDDNNDPADDSSESERDNANSVEIDVNNPDSVVDASNALDISYRVESPSAKNEQLTSWNDLDRPAKHSQKQHQYLTYYTNSSCCDETTGSVIGLGGATASTSNQMAEVSSALTSLSHHTGILSDRLVGANSLHETNKELFARGLNSHLNHLHQHHHIQDHHLALQEHHNQLPHHHQLAVQHQHAVTIDTSLKKLLECMSLYYSSNLTSPKWKSFKGLKLRLKYKIRLNNLIWRAWFLQCIRGRRPPGCQFTAPVETDVHKKCETHVLEGKYWKRKDKAIVDEYKKWRIFHKQKSQMICFRPSSFDWDSRAHNYASSNGPEYHFYPDYDMNIGYNLDDLPMPEDIEACEASDSFYAPQPPSMRMNMMIEQQQQHQHQPPLSQPQQHQQQHQQQQPQPQLHHLQQQQQLAQMQVSINNNNNNNNNNNSQQQAAISLKREQPIIVSSNLHHHFPQQTSQQQQTQQTQHHHQHHQHQHQHQQHQNQQQQQQQHQHQHAQPLQLQRAPALPNTFDQTHHNLLYHITELQQQQQQQQPISPPQHQPPSQHLQQAAALAGGLHDSYSLSGGGGSSSSSSGVGGGGARTEQRRVCHINAEQKRRCNIKNGFDTLKSILPSINQNVNVKISKASMLQKAAQYISTLSAEQKQQLDEKTLLKQQIENLKQTISTYQCQLPASGVPNGCQGWTQARDMLQDYARTRTLDNWKFWIFSLLIEPIFETYYNSVSTANLEESCKTIFSWLDRNCGLVSLRKDVLESLTFLSTSTNILNTPQTLPTEAVQAVRYHQQQQQQQQQSNPAANMMHPQNSSAAGATQQVASATRQHQQLLNNPPSQQQQLQQTTSTSTPMPTQSIRPLWSSTM